MGRAGQAGSGAAGVPRTGIHFQACGQWWTHHRGSHPEGERTLCLSQNRTQAPPWSAQYSLGPMTGSLGEVQVDLGGRARRSSSFARMTRYRDGGEGARDL